MKPTKEMFQLKSPCMDCPFRKDAAGVRHGVPKVLAYASHFTVGDGATFPCHRSVPDTISREAWSPWQEGQQMCAGGLIFAEKLQHRSRTVEALIDLGVYDPATLKDHDVVCDSILELVSKNLSNVEESV